MKKIKSGIIGFDLTQEHFIELFERKGRCKNEKRHAPVAWILCGQNVEGNYDGNGIFRVRVDTERKLNKACLSYR